MITDKEEDPTIRSLTPLIAPILQSVLGEPEEQLTKETRSQVEELVAYLKKVSGRG